ncbi:MAG: hypothetical protein ACI4QW_01335, partial [Clostridia bacterium]
MKKILMLLLSLLLLFALPAAAQEAENPTQRILEETLSAAEDIRTPGFNFAETAQKVVDGTLVFRFDTVVNYIVNLLIREVQDNISLLIKMLVLSVLAGVLCNLQQTLPGDGVGEISFLACFAVIAGLSVSIVAGLNELAVSAIDNMTLFIAALMPVMSSLALSARAAAFAGFYPGLFLAMQGFVAICKSILLPLITVITALSVINAVSGRFHITRLIDVARQTVKWGLGLLLTIFVGILGIHSVTANAAASVAGRTMKYALCNFVPLVGNVLAESAEAVIGSVRVIRGAVGLAGVLALL